MKHCYLYLDESGRFEAADDRNRRHQPSLVGGVLYDGPLNAAGQQDLAGTILQRAANRLGTRVAEIRHATELETRLGPGAKGQILPDVLTQALQSFQFVIFQNDERIHIVNSTYMYLNLCARGIVQLLYRLEKEYGDDVTLHAYIGARQDMAAQEQEGPGTTADAEGYIRLEEYRTRLQEHIAVERARSLRARASRSTVLAELADDKRNDVLVLADYVCNYRLTHESAAFRDLPQQQAENLKAAFREDRHFSFFEQEEDARVRRLMEEGAFSPLLLELCTGESLAEKNAALVVTRFADLSDRHIRNQLDRLALYLDDILAIERDLTRAGTFLQNAMALTDRIAALLGPRRAPLCLDKFRLDLLLYEAARQNHAGDIEAGVRTLEQAEPLLRAYLLETQDLNYYFILHNRLAVYQTDRFCFDEARANIERLETIQESIRLALMDTEEAGEIGAESAFPQLGYALGTKLQVLRCQMRLGKATFDEAAACYKTLCENLPAAGARLRDLQYLADCAAEDGRWEMALALLLRSVTPDAAQEGLTGAALAEDDLTAGVPENWQAVLCDHVEDPFLHLHMMYLAYALLEAAGGFGLPEGASPDPAAAPLLEEIFRLYQARIFPAKKAFGAGPHPALILHWKYALLLLHFGKRRDARAQLEEARRIAGETNEAVFGAFALACEADVCTCLKDPRNAAAEKDCLAQQARLLEQYRAYRERFGGTSYDAYLAAWEPLLAVEDYHACARTIPY